MSVEMSHSKQFSSSWHFDWCQWSIDSLQIWFNIDDFGWSIFQMYNGYGEASHAAQFGADIPLFIWSPRLTHFSDAIFLQRHRWIW